MQLDTNSAPVTTQTGPVASIPETEIPKGSPFPIDCIVALVLLLITVIGLAAYTATEGGDIAEKSSLINIAGRQRMLSQRQAKQLYRTGVSHAENNPIDKAESIRSLKKTTQIFDDTLSGFSKGGEVLGADGETVISIEPIFEPELRKSISEIEDLWEDYVEDLQPILTTRLSKIDSEMITAAADLTRENSDPLLDLSNKLTGQISNLAKDKQAMLSKYQQIGVIASLLLLAWIISRVFLKIKKNNNALQVNLDQLSITNKKLGTAQNELSQNALNLQNAYTSLQEYNVAMEKTSNQLRNQQEEAESIFSAVGEGLFLIDKDFKIGNQISDELFEIFETEHFSGRSLIDLLRPLITERDLHSLRSYLELQFDSNTAESQLDKYNPLEKIDVTLDWDGGGFSNKNLGFKFRRVYNENDEVVSVLVTVNDVTETVRLENELARAQESQERKTEIIFEIIEADPKELTIFLKKAESTLDDINAELESSKLTEDNQEIGGAGKKLVQSIFTKVHNLKGNGSLLGLKSIVDTASNVEDKLSDLQKKPSFKGDELLTSLVELAYLRETLNEFEEMRSTTLSNFKPRWGKARDDQSSTQTGQLVNDLGKLAKTIQNEYGKEAALNTAGLDLDDLPSKQFEHSKDLLIQLVRNSLVHGIEEPSERKEKMKWLEGSIQIKSSKDDSSDNVLGMPCYTIAYRDDGRGLDPKSIGKRAVELEIISEEELKKLSNAELSALIFDHSFSSIDVSDDHAGRGAGMGLIRNIVHQDLKGKLRMTYETNEYLEFTICIPQLQTSALNGDSSNQANLAKSPL